jgi:hypothetical protein
MMMAGTVRDAETGDPLVGVLVTVDGPDGVAFFFSDEDGQYRVRVQLASLGPPASFGGSPRWMSQVSGDM